MKTKWIGSELIEAYTLTPDELALLPKTARGQFRLGFAVLLKFLQARGFFPANASEVPDEVLACIAEQVGVPPERFGKYEWESRAIEVHRARIRKVTGFREASTGDAKKILEWLTEILEGRSYDFALDAAYERLRQRRIEAPAPGRMERIVRSALHADEQRAYTKVYDRLSAESRRRLDALIETCAEASRDGESDEEDWERSPMALLRKDPGPIGLESVLSEVAKLQQLRGIGMSRNLFEGVPARTLRSYRQCVAIEKPRELRRRTEPARSALLAAFCWMRSREITDNLVDLLIQVVHRIGARAESKVVKEIVGDFKRVHGKTGILFRVAEAAVGQPEGVVRKVIYPVVDEKTLRDLVQEFKVTGFAYRLRVQTRMRSSYGRHYRRMLPKILSTLEFRSNNELHRPVIAAIELLKRHANSSKRFYPEDEHVPIDGVVPGKWGEFVVRERNGQGRINRITYELCVLEALRLRLRTKEIWVVGADRYQDPDEDLPRDFADKRQTYYEALGQPMDVEPFISQLKERMHEALSMLNKNLRTNEHVEILEKGKGRKKKGWIKLSPRKPQAEPRNLVDLKKEITRRWPTTSLLDMLKEADLRASFTDVLRGAVPRGMMEPTVLQKRLLLCLYGIGTNLGIKRVCAGDHGENYDDLLYVRRRFIAKEPVRGAIARLVNAILAARVRWIWGEATTACASDSSQFAACDQNLMTEWHKRYGGRGIMVYWHVERKAACIYSQLKRCSSSEVASMIQGVLHHCTEMEVDKQYVDTHGQSHVGFAFCHLLGFRLLPRFKDIYRKKLNRPDAGEPGAYSRLHPILTRPINWDLIRQQYDEMIKYATALRLRTAEAETILRRFTRDNVKHPTYVALVELGSALRTIFLCEYLASEELRAEIQEALNIIELWNGINGFVFFGRGREITTNRRDDQEMAMLCLQLLQNTLVYINTLMIQEVLSEPGWRDRLAVEDLRALTPLVFEHVNPYGSFRLDMTERLPLGT